jgi:diguanylate cyclase (GGDEF)-like protein
MPLSTQDFHSSRPDPGILHGLSVFKTFSLTLVFSIALVALAANLSSALNTLFLHINQQMSLPIAICILLSCLSLSLSRSRSTERNRRLSFVLAGVVILISGFTLLGALRSRSALHPQTELWETATFFMLLGVLLLCLRVRQRLCSIGTDLYTALLCTIALAFFYNAMLSSLHTLAPSVQAGISLSTVACIVLLTLVAYSQRAEHGIYAILFAGGIGGKTARLTVPFAITLPVIRSIGRSVTHTDYVTAASALIVLSLLLLVCLRIQRLEREIHDLSLRDELTGLYNRRGFYVLAEQALRLAQRSGEPFSVLFLDLDNLKQINDWHGHEAGSTLIQQMAAILSDTFRETDVLSRLGGDEFVVACRASSEEIHTAIQRLQNSTANLNHTSAGPYNLSFSLGHATTDHLIFQPLEDMLQDADQAMYESKRGKKLPVPTGQDERSPIPLRT